MPNALIKIFSRAMEALLKLWTAAEDPNGNALHVKNSSLPTAKFFKAKAAT